jgi:uncharacterized repeat protein (TIGR03837 family)
MQLKKSQTRSLALFCKVVDNYGDIGICWRLARQLQQEHAIAVTLWVDDLASFKKICPAVTIDCEQQEIEDVQVRHWQNQDAMFTASDVADIVIEFFACDIPPAYIVAMAQCAPRPVWLNLEGLTAEEWVEGCHTLPSPHPTMSLTKYFFFPGFNNRTGGLLIEAELEQRLQQFQSDQVAMNVFLAQFGVTATEMASTKISLFCYPQAPVTSLFEVWQNNAEAITCLVPEGVAADAVELFLRQNPKAGTSATHGALTVRVLPFIPQPDYDKLLWSCDLNFVRGEDSFVRAQWANKPFIWHIYPQDENLHHKKLKAFLECHTATTESSIALSLAWNAVTTENIDWANTWRQFQTEMPEIAFMCINWQHQIVENGDLASNLITFCDTLR